MVNPLPTRFSRRAFTLIEILVVIAIMVSLAGLIVALAGVTGDKKVVSRTEAEIQKLVTLITEYKSKVGVYPPQGTMLTNSSLFYELTGMAKIPSGSGDTYSNLFATVAGGTLNTSCGVGGIINSAVLGDIEDNARLRRFLREVKPQQINTITVNNDQIVVLVAPAEGPNGRVINPFYYRVGSQTNGSHNPNSFDLWAEIKVRSGTRIIGNWKE